MSFCIFGEQSDRNKGYKTPFNVTLILVNRLPYICWFSVYCRDTCLGPTGTVSVRRTQDLVLNSLVQGKDRDRGQTTIGKNDSGGNVGVPKHCT